MSTCAREGHERVFDATLLQLAEPQGRHDHRDSEGEGLRDAYEGLTSGLIEKTAARFVEGAEWPQRIRNGLEALLGELAAQPEVARAVMRSLPAAGPAGQQCYMRFLDALVPFLSEGRGYAGADEELPSQVEMLAIGAAETIVIGEIDAGRTTQLPSMLPSILFSVLLPFLGPETASALMEEAKGGPGAGE